MTMKFRILPSILFCLILTTQFTSSSKDEKKAKQYSDSEECRICYEFLGVAIRGKCGHEICGNCFYNLLKQNENRCPLCRRNEFELSCEWKVHLRKSKKITPTLQTLQDLLPLICASEDVETIFEYLAIYQFDMNKTDMLGYFPISFCRKAKVAEVLLKRGCQIIHSDSNSKITTKSHPILYAIKKQNLEMIKFFVENGMENGVPTKWYLFSAVRSRNLEAVNLLLANGANIDECIFSSGKNSLYIAAEHGDIKMVEFLMANGANPNALDQMSRTRAYIAAENNNFEVMKILMKIGANINYPQPYGRTPLFIAAELNHMDMVNFLLHHGADVNLLDKYNRSQLYCAAQEGSLQTVNVLLQNGAVGIYNGRTALTIASEKGYAGIVNALIEHNENVNQRDNYGDTPLYLAAKLDHLRIVKILIGSGADVNLPIDNGGFNPLYAATENGNKEIVEVLLQNGAKINQCTKNGFTALYVAISNQYEKIIEILVEELNDNLKELNKECNENGTNQFHLAATYGDARVVNFFSTKTKANVDECQKDGKTPLYLAAKEGHLEIVQILVEEQALVNKRIVETGMTPLHIAAQNGHHSIVEFLITKTAKVNQITESGHTALTLAAQSENLKTVEILLQNGADIHHCVQCDTALSFASENEDLRMIDFLLNHGAIVTNSNVYTIAQEKQNDDMKNMFLAAMKKEGQIAHVCDWNYCNIV